MNATPSDWELLGELIGEIRDGVGMPAPDLARIDQNYWNALDVMKRLRYERTDGRRFPSAARV